MNLNECFPNNETLASACEFAAGMVKAQGAGTDKPTCDLELHLNLAARRLREIGLAPADGVWMPLATGANTDELVDNLMRDCGADSADMSELENRLNAVENFLEIRERDNPLEANTLDNRIIDNMNFNADAMNENLAIAITELERRLLERLVAIETALED